MTRLLHRYSARTRLEREAGLPTSDLNRATDALYAECRANGGHHASGHSVTRDFMGEPRQLPVCGHCLVPVTGRLARSWNGPI